MTNTQFSLEYISTVSETLQTETLSSLSNIKSFDELDNKLKSMPSDSTENKTHVSEVDVSRFSGRLRDSDVFHEIKRHSERSIRVSTKNKDRVGFGVDDNKLNVSYKSKSLFSESKSLINADETLSLFDLSRKVGERKLILDHLKNNKRMVKKINMLKYRDNIFRAASKLSKEMPPYPDWTYEDEDVQYLEITKINVGGRTFQIFEDTLMNLLNTKLATCIRSHKSEGVPFFDRDSVCFAAVIQFFRTGRLHKPANVCNRLFEEELEFWGIKEQFMESCCWSGYDNFKTSTQMLKKYKEDMKKGKRAENKSDNALLRCKEMLFNAMTIGTDSVLSKWLSLSSALFIVIGVFNVIMSPSPVGRIDTKTGLYSEIGDHELLKDYIRRTDVSPAISSSELCVAGYFLSEIVFKLILSTDKLEFFSDTFNWIDLMTTMTSLITTRVIFIGITESLECYVILLKIPRILSLFKLSTRLRSGMEAFILTFRACAKELRLILLILIVSLLVFGSLLFVVEMVNETETERSRIKNIHMGMWLALETMSSVGYGDIHIKSNQGYLLGFVCIICGVVVCRLPTPFFLEKFITYYHQANGRLNHKTELCILHLDPEAIHEAALKARKFPRKKETNRTLKKSFYS